MSQLSRLPIVDLRHHLPARDWIIGHRDTTSSITWHWNGPAVPLARQTGASLIRQLIADTEWQMRPGWGGTKNGAPHLMYHLVVDLAGVIYQACDLNEILWHCAHADGNGHGLALHFPLGAGQFPSRAQIASAIRVTDALRADYAIPRSRVFGHLEWKHATACPGPRLMAELNAYRNGATPKPVPTEIPAGIQRFRVKESLRTSALVRQAPQRHWPDGREVTVAGRLKPGTIVYVDVIKPAGEAVNGDRRWAHMARIPNEQADLGFISMTLLEAA